MRKWNLLLLNMQSAFGEEEAVGTWLFGGEVDEGGGVSEGAL